MRNSLFRCALLLSCCVLPRARVHAQVTNNLPVATAPMPAWTQSIVRIRYTLNGKELTGSGVIVSASGYVLTAGHVGDGMAGQPGTRIRIGQVASPYGPVDYRYAAKELYRATDANTHDLKLLQITNPPSAPAARLTPAPLATTAPFPGNEVFVAGFPNLPFAYLPHSPGAGLSIYKTAILSCYAEAGTNVPTRLHYGGGSLPGFSGGPVFNHDGQLLGIHSARATDNVTDLFYPEAPCTENATPAKPCFGNTLRFPVMGAQNQLRTQEITLNHMGLKTVLDNFSWGTSIWRIPQKWVDLIRQLWAGQSV